MATKGRTTATFEPYYWEAYNQIVQPHRFDWYLVTRWLPDLGPEGFAVVKALRNLCYFNPSTGTLRDTCQITMDELADMVGMKRTSLYRLFDNNAALAAFIQKQPDVVFVEGRTRRLPPRFRVCMDTPIHPADAQHYRELQVEKHEDEADRRKSQYEIYEKRKSQKEGRKSQNTERKSQFGISSSGISLPPDYLLKECTPSAAPSHKCVPPEGEEERAPPRSIERPENQRGLALVRETLKRRQSRAASEVSPGDTGLGQQQPPVK